MSKKRLFRIPALTPRGYGELGSSNFREIYGAVLGVQSLFLSPAAIDINLSVRRILFPVTKSVLPPQVSTRPTHDSVRIGLSNPSRSIIRNEICGRVRTSWRRVDREHETLRSKEEPGSERLNCQARINLLPHCISESMLLTQSFPFEVVNIE